MKPHRFFTLEEANALLPQIENLMNRLHEKKACCDKLHDHLFMEEIISAHEKQSGQAAGPQTDRDAQNLDNHVHSLGEEMRQFRTLGCVLRSLEQGWVDFPAKQGNEVIFYVWRKGEKVINFYRSSQSPATERLPLR